MEKLKVAIVGCGRISVVYKEAFLKNLDQIEVCWAIDKEMERAREFAQAFDHCDFGDSFETLLEQSIDVVHICTPHFLHKDQVEKCMEAGFHVLTEKPMGISLEEADALIQLSERSTKKLGVIFQNRYIEGVQTAKAMLDAGKLGKAVGAWSLLTWWRPPSYYECDWKGSWAKEGGGVLIDQAIHSIDLVQYLVSSPVQWIHGHIDNRVLRHIEVEDVADAAIGFENGCIYNLFATNYFTHNEPIQIQIACEYGSIHIKGLDVTIECEGITHRICPTSDNGSGLSYWGSHHRAQIEAFYESVRTDSPTEVSAIEAKKALEIVLGVYQSSREGKRIELR